MALQSQQKLSGDADLAIYGYTIKWTDVVTFWPGLANPVTFIWNIHAEHDKSLNPILLANIP